MVCEFSRQLSGIDYLVCNTDSQHLATSLCEKRIQMGSELTEGLGLVYDDYYDIVDDDLGGI